jgi:uncharacterized protein with NRDE domain
MCTLVALFGVNPDVPLVVAANRDELYARPWASPEPLRGTARVVGGRDLTQKGTWLGVTATGFFAGVTNQRTYHSADPTKLSRGQLVLDVLIEGSADGARERLAAVDARRYNPFNLLFGDARALYVAYARDEERVAVESLRPGIWVLNNDTIGSRDFPKASLAKERVQPLARKPWPELQRGLEMVLGDHTLPPEEDISAPPEGSVLTRESLRALQGVCVHTPLYGTSSATLLALDAGSVRDYRFAPGPPCVTPFVSAMGAFGLNGSG